MFTEQFTEQLCFMPFFFVTHLGNTCSLKPQVSYFYWGGEIPQGLVTVKLSVPNRWSASTESLSTSLQAVVLHMTRS